ncbi:peroxiredoxin-like family protein [Mesonia sp. K7]|uniref:peroxiredoxin-like family protein n=1 Tax=Mesonia sp. K7 TaxID=2218606 RepID=UPI000DAA301C|nr:peroxiredoxin-like family protein [Mesonia sp. K7]PZD77748.1 hypothetical protein DNG35_07890 [Mesonia sp. K7]
MNYKSFLIAALAVFVLISCKGDKKTNDENSLEEEVVADLTQYGISENSNPKGLEVGETVPAVEFSLNQEERTLEELYQESPLVVIFYRGYWCPACNQHLATFEKELESLKEADVSLLAITPESEENIEKTKELSKATFPIVSDRDGVIMDAFDVSFEVTEDYQEKLNQGTQSSLIEINANNEARLPIPATFVINQEGKIIYKHFDPDYKNRASIKEILESIKQ